MKHERTKFRGSIRFISLSPHGDPEGIVLNDGSFIKAPPHSLREKSYFKIGKLVSGEGELITETPNRVIHHAVIKCGTKVLADDAVSEEERERLKEEHEVDLGTREDAEDRPIKLTGKIAAVGTKPKGEVDRLILEDGTSVHVPKEIALSVDDALLGTEVHVKGHARTYGGAVFVKAKALGF